MSRPDQVCIYCKRTQNEKGEWIQPFSLSEGQGEDPFVKTVCPECSRERFPKFYRTAKGSGAAQRKERPDMVETLAGKRLLIVDDEPDIIETLVDSLDMCQIDSALNFQSAKAFLSSGRYDAAILDIMGVNGYGLLEIAGRNRVPVIILTAHALSADNFKKSIRKGAHIYLPKDKMIDIADYLVELIGAAPAGLGKSGRWFTKLSPFFREKFGSGWTRDDDDFWKAFTEQFRFSREELDRLL